MCRYTTTRCTPCTTASFHLYQFCTALLAEMQRINEDPAVAAASQFEMQFCAPECVVQVVGREGAVEGCERCGFGDRGLGLGPREEWGYGFVWRGRGRGRRAGRDRELWFWYCLIEGMLNRTGGYEKKLIECILILYQLSNAARHNPVPDSSYIASILTSIDSD